MSDLLFSLARWQHRKFDTWRYVLQNLFCMLRQWLCFIIM